MGRIRSIKPEFPQSESIGRLTRDARLLFVQLWTIVDDEGRARAASRMLASLLYPYDDDAGGLIEGWLTELAAADLVRLYEADGNQYLEIVKWEKHQKIDRPSKSKLPPLSDGSPKSRETSPKSREVSTTDMDLGGGKGREEDSDPNGSDAAASRDIRVDLFGKGLKTLAEITGKTPDSCRSLVGKWLKSVNDEAIHVVAAIENAERNRVADPVAWINRALASHTGDRHGKRTVLDAARDLVDKFGDVPAADGRPASSSPVRLLPQG